MDSKENNGNWQHGHNMC